jgi:hypothetical protein
MLSFSTLLIFQLPEISTDESRSAAAKNPTLPFKFSSDF